MKDRRHLFFWPVVVIGIAFIAIPFATSVPSKAKAAQSMMDSFRPVLRAATVARTADYYYDTLVGPGPVSQAAQALAAKTPKPVAMFAQQLYLSLDRGKPFVQTMLANATNFQKLDNLPSLGLLTWVFVIPGILLVLVGGVPLAMGPVTRRVARTA